MQTSTKPETAQGGPVASNDQLGDKDLLDFLDEHKQYIVGFAPSGDWSAFDIARKGTCYGKTIRDCLTQLQLMHKDIGS